MRWFRRQTSPEQAPSAAAAPETPPAETGDSVPEADKAERKPRRRGSRGGRGRKKKTEATSAEKAPAAEPKKAERKKVEPKKAQPKKAEPKKEADRKPRRKRATRKAPTGARSALAGVKKEIFVSVEVGEQRVAVVEDGKPAEVYLERRGRRSIAGNVYKGVVDNVLPGMEASFVEIGLEKNGFLYVDEIVVPELEGKQRHGRRIQELIERGQEVLVQAVKDPMGTKGARLTTEISLPGRFVVYVPFGDGIGVSRRLEDTERERLKAITKELDLPEGGLIVRTAAEGASKEELEGDLAFLQKLWSTIQGRASRAEAPALVYQEAELPLRIVRDLFIRDFERVVVDHDRTYRKIVGYLKRTSPDLADRVELYGDAEPLMERFGVDEAIRSTLGRRVDLPSGGYLIFDYAEAFTVIDVNTGRFVGARGKATGARLEDTITKNNLEAVEEVVRQLRLRDIGGIIVIDFIDMANPKNRQLVEDALKHELERDRTKTYVVEISPLGLVEMTRQNVTDGPREILTVACSACGGDGVVVSDETYAVDAERRLRRLARESKAEAFLVELNSRIAGILIGPGGARLDDLERETGRRFAFQTKPRAKADHFAVLKEGPAAEIEPQSFPVAPGQELKLTIEDVHLQHEEDGVARLDGYVIAVAGAAERVGETVKARIDHAGRTSAHAVLADGAAAETKTPTKTGEDKGAAEKDDAAVEKDDAAVEKDEAAVEKDEAAVEEAPKPRKRTRRGSRGGRGRKKKTESAAAADGAAGTEETAEAEAVPAATDGSEPETTEAGAEEEAPKAKKRTRRGSRGGRRRRKPAAASGGDEAVGAVAGDEEGG